MIATSDTIHQGTAVARLATAVDAILPPQYSFTGGSASPRSMGSALLANGADGRVAWDQIWTTFCDLALAGGPPHRGRLLDAPSPEEVAAEPAGHQLVSEEVARGIRMASGLQAAPAGAGWVAVSCSGEAMATWLLRAVMAENVFVRRRGDTLLVPAGPRFRIAKEVKNVVVAITKPAHYWSSHMSAARQEIVGSLLLEPTAALLEPASGPEVLQRHDAYRAAAEGLASAAAAASGRLAAPTEPPGWVGIRLDDEISAAWLVRSAIAENILARREEETLFLPVPDPSSAGGRFEAAERLGLLCRIWGEVRNEGDPASG